MLRQFFDGFARRYLGVYALGIGFLLATNWLTVAIPGLVRDTFDALEARDANRIDQFALLIVVYSVLVIVVRTLSRVLFFNPGRTIEFRVRNQMLERLLSMGGAWFRRVAHGDLVSRATNDATFVRALVGFSVLQLLNLVIAASMALWQMLATDVTLTLLCMVPMTLSLAVLRRGTGRLFQAMRDGQVELGQLSDHILETYKGMSAIALAHAEPAFLARFDRHNERYTAINVSVTALRCFVLPLASQTGGLAVFVLLFYGGAKVASGALTVGDLAAYSAYIGVLVSSLVMAGWLIASLQRGVVALERVWEVLGLQPERVATGATLPARDEGLTVRARSLGYRYPDAAEDDAQALDGVDFELRPGGLLGIYGAVGSGKSTLVALLAGELEAKAGALQFDGVDASTLQPAARAAAVAVVPQTSFLFSRALRENVGFVDPPAEVDQARVVAAVAAAQLTSDVQRMPHGLDTVVGERGQNLSGGQRQRAQLARALYRPARLLVLDDVLSAVDHDTEDALLRAIADQLGSRAERPSTVLVSSRLSALRQADEILVLEQGRVVERGTHQALIEADGVYAAAFRAQDESEHAARAEPPDQADQVPQVAAGAQPTATLTMEARAEASA